MSHKKEWAKRVKEIKDASRGGWISRDDRIILDADRIVRAAAKVHLQCQRDPDFAPECSSCINKSLCRAVEAFEEEGGKG